MLSIYTYRHDGLWVFDDDSTGLRQEPFVSGADTMIDAVIKAKEIPNAARGFALTFSDAPFPGHEVELRWLRADPVEGNWYEATIGGRRIEGWLCPALLLYFKEAPRRIFVRAEQGVAVTPRTTPLQSHPPQTPPAAPEE